MKKKSKKESFFEGKKFDKILLISLIFFLFLIVAIIIYYNMGGFSLKEFDELKENCLERCSEEDSINFNWDLMSYVVNESEGTIQCNCVRKSRDSLGYTQGVGLETKTLYLDLQTFEEINP